STRRSGRAWQRWCGAAGRWRVGRRPWRKGCIWSAVCTTFAKSIAACACARSKARSGYSERQLGRLAGPTIPGRWRNCSLSGLPWRSTVEWGATMPRGTPKYPVMDTERHLLFGLLALRAGLIQARTLSAAWAAWSARPDCPFADLLIERGHLTGADSAAVELLLEQETRKQGSKPPGLSADERARRALATLEEFVPGGEPRWWPSTAPHAEVLPLGPAPRTGDRYTVIRLHDSGGIGRVWGAWDHDLNREVALKDLHPEWAEQPDLRRRFLDEARITGHLDHPGIVPVHDLARGAEDSP